MGSRGDQDMPSSKRCPRCEMTKSASEFWLDSHSASGLASYCKACKRVANPKVKRGDPSLRRWDTDHSGQRVLLEKQCPRCDQVLPASAFWRNKTSQDGRHAYCKACARDYERERYPEGKPGRTARYLRDEYGMTVADKEAMHAAQGGLCAICRQAPANRLDVDHCHETGEVRGLLCHRCNTAIGLLRDDPDLMFDAATYVLAHRNVLALVGESDG